MVKVPSTLIGPFTQANPGLGGVCTFVGEVRGGEGVEALELTHYEPLTLPGMHELADRAFARFELMGLLQQLNAGGMSVVLVTHEHDIAHFASRIISFRDGHVVDDRRVEKPANAQEMLREFDRQAA